MSLLSSFIRQSGIVDELERLGPMPSRRRLLTAGGVLGSLLAGSARPLIVTSGTGMANIEPGRPATEEDAAVSSAVVPRSR